MELFLGGVAAFIIEVLVLALLVAPRWTLRRLARPSRALGRRLRGRAVRVCARVARGNHRGPATSPGS